MSYYARIDYMYRSEDNFKNHGAFYVVSDEIIDAGQLMSQIEELLDSGYFDPSVLEFVSEGVVNIEDLSENDESGSHEINEITVFAEGVVPSKSTLVLSLNTLMWALQASKKRNWSRKCTRKFFRQVYTIEVLTEDEPMPDPVSLDYIHYQITQGYASGKLSATPAEQIEAKAMASMLRLQGSQPEFFNITDDGEDDLG